jgi:predicted dehydrogenase
MSHRALVVGLGQIGMGYDLDADPKVRIATLARAFSEHSEFELVGGVDLDSARRELFQDRYARPSFANIETAIEETQANVIAIAVPTEAHCRVLHQAVQFGTLKAILCEKPLSYDFAEATAMVSLAEKSGVVLFTNYMRRCDPAVVEVRRQIVSERISGPFKGICWYSKGLFHNGSHFLNLLQYWLGEVKDFQIINPGRLWGEHDHEPDVEIEFALGKVCFLAVREESFSHHSVELIASNGRLRYERGSMEWQPSAPDSNQPGYVVLNTQTEYIESGIPRIQWNVVDQIARFLSGEATSICTGSQGLATLQVLTEIKNKL